MFDSLAKLLNDPSHLITSIGGVVFNESTLNVEYCQQLTNDTALRSSPFNKARAIDVLAYWSVLIACHLSAGIATGIAANL
jgi:hypothetical protein